jgi:transposase
MQKYHIRLTEVERQGVKKAIKKTTSQQAQKRGNILLDLDESSGTRQHSIKEIALRQRASVATISEVCKRYEADGITAVLGRKTRATPPVPAKVTGEVEAHIIAVCCSAPPEGKANWSMQMIADKIVLDGVVDSISGETVRLVLKKRNSSRI